VALLLAEEGATVVVAEVDHAGAADVLPELRALTPRSLAVACDIASPASVTAAAASVEGQLGRCDVLVNNAGIMSKSRLEDETLDAWSRMITVNLRGAFLCTQAFGRLMIAGGGGSIVNVASIGATVPTVGAGAYCASKAGILALTKQTALEWGPKGVRANAVSPGYMRTTMTEQNYAVPGVMEQRAALIPLGRIGDPQEMASVIAYLASDDASFVNGVNIIVDGGFQHTATRSVPHAQPLVGAH
jgi:NAD(P)-dependent dehydrogenase (short-subunit alcohol dehydrogenase family)